MVKNNIIAKMKLNEVLQLVQNRINDTAQQPRNYKRQTVSQSFQKNMLYNAFYQLRVQKQYGSYSQIWSKPVIFHFKLWYNNTAAFIKKLISKQILYLGLITKLSVRWTSGNRSKQRKSCQVPVGRWTFGLSGST